MPPQRKSPAGIGLGPANLCGRCGCALRPARCCASSPMTSRRRRRRSPASTSSAGGLYGTTPGVQRVIRDYLDQAGDAARQVRAGDHTSARASEDTFVQWAQTDKLSGGRTLQLHRRGSPARRLSLGRHQASGSLSGSLFEGVFADLGGTIFGGLFGGAVLRGRSETFLHRDPS